MFLFNCRISLWHTCAIFCLSSGVLAALDPEQMAQHLKLGLPILGKFSDPDTQLTRWMGIIQDSARIEQINIPGTHDASAWNFTGVGGDRINTQDLSIFGQLNAGVRFLDIRFGLDESTNVLRVYHGDALLSATVSLEDVLWGLYHFLDIHPSETLLVSLKVDHGSVSIPVQKAVHALITRAPTNDYWVQSTTLPCLGAARRKIILFRRFGLDSATNADLTPVGLDVSTGWADNDADFSIAFSPGEAAYIEDLYQLNGDVDQVPAVQKVEEKFQAFRKHVGHAQVPANASQIFISFASGFGAGVGDNLTPKVLAVGGVELKGMNQKVDEWLSSSEEQHLRLGIVLYDFFESRPQLVRRTIGLKGCIETD